MGLGTAGRVLIMAGVLCCAMTPGACNYAGPALWLMSDDRTPAVHRLDPKRSVVVFVDDRRSVLPTRLIRQRISTAAEQRILSETLVEARVISWESLQSVVTAERFSKPLSIAEIGRAVEAEQVIYATVDQFALTPDGLQFAPSARMRVKVIDATTGDRLFPKAGDGGGAEAAYTLGIAEKVRAAGLPKSNAERMKAEQELADELGRRLGELFFKHSSRDPNSKIGS